MSSGKYNAPEGAPPTYMAPVHLDAGPADSRGANYYGSPPPPQGQYSQGPYQQSYQQPYQQQPYQNQGPYGPPQQYPPGQQPMYYQQPPGGYYNGPPPGGRGTSAGEGICAGLFGALACCCCLDFLF